MTRSSRKYPPPPFTPGFKVTALNQINIPVIWQTTWSGWPHSHANICNGNCIHKFPFIFSSTVVFLSVAHTRTRESRGSGKRRTTGGQVEHTHTHTLTLTPGVKEAFDQQLLAVTEQKHPFCLSFLKESFCQQETTGALVTAVNLRFWLKWESCVCVC